LKYTIGIPSNNSSQNFKNDDDEQDALLNPIVLVEVLSPSTEVYDRGKKSQRYRTIPSLREYLLVAQDSQHIEHFVRYSEHQWLLSEITRDQATIHLPSLECTLLLADVYAKVPLAGCSAPQKSTEKHGM